MSAKVFIVDDKYTGQDKPLGIVVDTMFFVELIDSNSPYQKPVEKFFKESVSANANLYMTAKTNEELLYRIQVYYTLEEAKLQGINTAQYFKKGNGGFKGIQKALLAKDPNYFARIDAQRDAVLKTFTTMAQVIYPANYKEHLAQIPILQKKLNGCVEPADIATILIANDNNLNTFATSDGGYHSVDGINIIATKKGIYTGMKSSKSAFSWIDITK